MSDNKGCLGKPVGCCGPIVLAGLAVAAGLALLARQAPGPPVGGPGAPSRPIVSVGDRVVIAKAGTKGFLAFDVDGAWDALVAAENTGDVRNVLELVEADLAFGVPSGQEATVVRLGFASALVRLPDGRQGWIQVEELSPAP